VRTLASLSENLAWIAGIIYGTIPAFWLLVHPFADFWRSRKGKVYPILVMLWFGIWIVAGVLTFPYRHQRLWSEWSWIGWAGFLTVAIFTYHRIGHGFGRANLLGQAELRPQAYEQRLVTSGVHARVRHPFYLAHWLMLTAWTVGGGTVALVSLWCFALATGSAMIWTEDRELERRFGDEYRDYKRRVPAVLPRF
jgi:protein-S-isoprenylcysteine O-methyltransferase Ste14